MPADLKLNQIIAIEKGVKSRAYGELTTLHKESQKAESFNGFVKNYRKKTRMGKTSHRSGSACSSSAPMC